MKPQWSTGIGVTAAGVGLMVASCTLPQPPNPGESPVGADVEVPSGVTPAPYAPQDAAKATLWSILADQQQAWLLTGGQFVTDYEDLRSQPPAETELYRFAIAPSPPDMAIATATAKQPDLPSFTGSVFAIEANLPVLGLCQTQQPAQTPPPSPQIVGITVECPPDAVRVDPG